MSKKNVSVFVIRGMHCRACELLIESEVKDLAGVVAVEANQKTGEVKITHKQPVDVRDLAAAVKKVGYSLVDDTNVGDDIASAEEHRNLPLFSTNQKLWFDLAKISVVLILLYFFIKRLGFIDAATNLGQNATSLPFVFLIGLTAGFSTCIALVGGLALGIIAKFSQQFPNATAEEKLRPQLMFNVGRIASFFFFGGLIGLLGSVFKLSSTVNGIITIFVGLVMLLIGLQLIKIFPRLASWQVTLPKSVAKIFGVGNRSNSAVSYSDNSSIMLGSTTFFLPCGFTQMMQLFAMSSGSFLQGALIMSVFAIGTSVGLLSLGGIAAFLKNELLQTFFKVSGLIVIALAVANIGNGLNLVSLTTSLPGFTQNTSTIGAMAADPAVTIENGIQVVRMTQFPNGYSPNKFTIKKNIKVRWIINSTNPYTCASSIVVPSLQISKNLEAGENIIEFTPTSAGTIKFSCSMGMYTGSFTVIEN